MPPIQLFSERVVETVSLIIIIVPSDQLGFVYTTISIVCVVYGTGFETTCSFVLANHPIIPVLLLSPVRRKSAARLRNCRWQLTVATLKNGVF